MIEKLFIEAAQSREKFAANKYATAGLPANLALLGAIPIRVSIGEKPFGKAARPA